MPEVLLKNKNGDKGGFTQPFCFSLQKNKRAGFTLIEILITLSLIVLLSGVGLLISFDVYRNDSFKAERDMVVALLERARSRSMTNINESPHGLKIGSDSYTLFEGASYATRVAAKDEVIPGSPAFTRTGLDEVVFEQLSGNPSANGDINIVYGGRTHKITLNGAGGIDW